MTKNKKKVWVWPPLTSSQLFPSERDLVIWTRDIDEQNAGGGGGVLPYKSDRGACQKTSRTPLKGTRILFYGHVPNSFPPIRCINSMTTNYITGTANFNSNEDNLISNTFFSRTF